MNESTERLLVDWLVEGPDRGPSHGLDRALAATRRTSQRPGWTIKERWLPAQLAIRPAMAPRPYLLILAAALVATALAGSLLLIGSQRHPAPLFGLAKNGSIIVGVDGHLWISDSDGTDARRLFIGQTFASSPAFSPDGTRLAFKTRGADRSPWSIWVADADGSNARSVTGEFAVVASGLDGISWSPDGSAITFASSDKGITRLYRVDLQGGPPQALAEEGGDRSYPAVSPDGQWLAYQKRSASGPAKVSLMVSHPDGSAERELRFIPRGDASFAAPQWSAGSDRIAYFRSEVGGHVVAIVDLEGNEIVVSLPGEDAVNPAWSPDARHLAYAITDRSVVVDVANSSKRTTIPQGLADCGVTWAPDGTALLGIDGPCSGLYVIPVDDPGAAIRVDVPEGEIDTLAWQRTAP